MSFLPLLLRALPYLLCVALGAYGAHHIDHASYARLEARYAGYQADIARRIEQQQQAAQMQSLVLQERAQKAEQSYVTSQNDLDTYRRTHPIRVFINGARSQCVPATTPDESDDDAGSPERDIQRVLKADSGLRGNGDRDIGPLLDALGAKADQVSDELREYQGRQSPLGSP